eukprot:476174-Alexandrium_andersonii.AAC.1
MRLSPTCQWKCPTWSARQRQFPTCSTRSPVQCMGKARGQPSCGAISQCTLAVSSCLDASTP